MISNHHTSGLTNGVQVIDATGVCINEADYQRTSAALQTVIFGPSGDQILIETISDRLASIRRKSHSELGEAWTRLARM